MDFIASVVAIVAIIMVLRMRKRVAALEQRIAGGVALPRAAGSEVADDAPEFPIPPRDPRTSPLEVFAKPAPAAPPPAPATTTSERLDEAQIEDIIREAATPPAPPPPPEPAAPSKSFEERFGASWVVWIGGLALALGGIFLVQYSIEAGLIGPGVRVLLGGLLATFLVAAGEWTRRREIGGNAIYAENAHIPSILTAAGTVVAFATIYAAYALYDFLVPGTAFVLLGIVAFATLAASLLHGPWLAALGQIGAFVVPALVAAEVPNYWALYVYLAFVTAASFALARARLWLWLAVTAVVFGFLWSFAGIEDVSVDAITPHVFHAVIGFVLVAALLVAGLFYGPDADDGRIDRLSSYSLGAYLLAAAAVVILREHDPLALAAFSALIVATVAIAWRAEAATGAIPIAGVLSALVIAQWAVGFDVRTLVAPGGPAIAPDPSRASYGMHLVLGFGYAALFAIAGFFAQGRSSRAEAPITWAAAAVLVPLAIVVALYYRVYGFERSIPFAGIALLLAALFAVATEMLTKREQRPGLPSAAAIFATGSIAALALALTLALEKGWLTVALGLMVPGIAWIERQRPLPWLRALTAIVAGAVIARIFYEPRIVPGIDATPIFNWILYGYGLPAISFWVAGWLLRKRADDTATRVVDFGAIVLTMLTGFLEIRHYIHGGNIYHPSADLAEIALQVSLGGAMVIGLERLRLRTNSVVHDAAALYIAGTLVFVIVAGLLVFENPWLNGTDVGGLFINLNLLGYAIPAMLAAAVGLMTRETRPQWYRTIAAVTAVVLSLTYLSFQVSRFYQGPRLGVFAVTGAEGYTYSAVWLAFGVLLLVIGIFLRSQPVRMCSAAVVIVTIGKVFLLDLAGLTGVWRALSFIGLGLVLVGIGYLYQRLLFAKKPPEEGGLRPLA